MRIENYTASAIYALEQRSPTLFTDGTHTRIALETFEKTSILSQALRKRYLELYLGCLSFKMHLFILHNVHSIYKLRHTFQSSHKPQQFHFAWNSKLSGERFRFPSQRVPKLHRPNSWETLQSRKKTFWHRHDQGNSLLIPSTHGEMSTFVIMLLLI